MNKKLNWEGMQTPPISETEIKMNFNIIEDYLHKSLSQVLERLDDNLLYWQITWSPFPFRSKDFIPNVPEHKIALLSLILSLYPESYLIYYDDPIRDGELSGDWKELNDKIWLIPNNVNVAETLKWLDPGDWTISNSKKPARLNVHSPSKKLLKKNGIKILNQMKDHNMPYILMATSDDVAWIILLNPDYDEKILN